MFSCLLLGDTFKLKHRFKLNSTQPIKSLNRELVHGTVLAPVKGPNREKGPLVPHALVVIFQTNKPCLKLYLPLAPTRPPRSGVRVVESCRAGQVVFGTCGVRTFGLFLVVNTPVARRPGVRSLCPSIHIYISLIINLCRRRIWGSHPGAASFSRLSTTGTASQPCAGTWVIFTHSSLSFNMRNTFEPIQICP